MRVSSINQATEERGGFDRQRAAIQQSAAGRGIEIVREFSDSITGEAEWSQRPGFTDMVAAILDNGVRMILVENVSRVARSYVVADTLLTYLASKGIALISCDTGEDVAAAIMGDPMKRCIVQVMAAFSEMEKNSLIRKLRAARQRKKAATGRCEGQKPFGTRPGEDATLRRIHELHGYGAGAVRIAKALNTTGHRTRKGGLWRPSTVQGILGRGAGALGRSRG